MPERFRSTAIRALRWSERYTHTDMVYLASGGFWLLLGQASAVLLSLGLAVAFGHLASQDTYGNYKYVLSLGGLLTAFSLSGIGTAVIQASARGNEGVLRQAFRLNLRWSLGIAVLALGGAFYCAVIKPNPFLALAFLLTALFTPFLNSLQLYDPFLVGKKEFRRDTIYNILDAIFPTLLLIATLFLVKRAIILILVYFLSTTLFVGFFYLRSLRQAKNDSEDPELFRYSLHLSIMAFIGTVADRIDSILVFTFLGPSQLGVYSYAIAMPEQIKAVVKSVVPLSLPKFTQRPLQEIRKTIWKRMLLLGFGIMIAALLYIVAAPYLFKYFFPVYLDSVRYSQIYALSLIFGFVTPLTSLFQAHKKTRALYITSNAGALILILLLPPMIYFYGIMGAILSQIIYRGVNVVITIWQYLSLDSSAINS